MQSNPPRPRPRIGLVACIWALAATAAVAQPTAPPHTSALQALFAQVWRLQPEAQALALRRQAAQAQRDGADAWTAEPAALELQTKTDRPGSRLGNREHTVGVALPLWLPGERARRAALGDAELQAVHSSSQAAQLALAARVREAWWLWQRTCGDLALAQDQMDSAQALEADVARRFAVGDMARADLYQAQAREATALAQALEADTRVQRERERLAADLRAAAAQARAAAAQQQAMARNAELARATRGFVAKAFALGEADWPTRLRVEQDAVLAERQWLRARIDAAAAVSTLRQALGLLPQ